MTGQAVPMPTTPKSFMLFHWSPSTRRKGINRYGLKPGCWSIDRLWKPPYVAFGQSPSVAWILSGGHSRGRHIPEWDLWMVWSDRLQGYEEFYEEIRVYHRIFKRDVWYVGSRSNSVDGAAAAGEDDPVEGCEYMLDDESYLVETTKETW